MIAQVVNTDDLTKILGERPFRSQELRNIDKVRLSPFSIDLLAGSSHPATCDAGLRNAHRCNWLASYASVLHFESSPVLSSSA